MKDTKIIALAGKGGVGKTTLSSAIVRVLTEKYKDAGILAIDADPAVGLSTALGITVHKTLDDIRREVIDKAKSGSGKEAIELLGEVRFRIFDALAENNKFAFLAIGRPEGAGCYCSVNAYLKEVIAMISRDFDFIVIDGEAGLEQINRRVMEKVTHLVLVSDGSRKGIGVAESVKAIADELVMYEKCGLVINRLENPDLAEYIQVKDMDILGIIPSDPAHAANDVMGKSVFELSADSEVMCGARSVLEKLGL